MATQEAETAVLVALPTNEDEALQVSELVEASGAKRATVQRVLKVLVAAGKVHETGEGKRGNPRRYWAGGMNCGRKKALHDPSLMA